jgi:hypothetical protein
VIPEGVRRRLAVSRRVEQLRLLTVGREPARVHRRFSVGHRDRATALAHLAQWATSPSEESPVFVLAATGRSGSTLLQRVVASSGEVLVWGEPYADSGLVPRLGSSLQVFSRIWPEPHFVRRGEELAPARLTVENVENLYPHPEALVAAHLAFHDALFGAPARDAGYVRWGLKETRLGGDDARYLRFLYPNGRLLFLVRDPVDVWASYRRWAGWYLDWPGGQVRTPQAFARAWARLAASYTATAAELGAMVVRYEDLVGDPSTVDRVAAHVGVALDRTALDTPTHSSRTAVPAVEERIVRRLTRAAAEPFGY